MAAKTPVAQGTTGWVPPQQGVWGGVNAAAADLLSNGSIQATQGCKLSIFYFSDIDDTDTWTTDLPGLVAVAWQGDQADTDKVAATITTQTNHGTGTAGVITFDAQNANSNGWLWVLHKS